jgi:glucose-1-phosphate thymidylyltransferase
MKGIVLAGGSGSRLWPITEGVSKQLLPIYDKPMVYYPISVLMLAGIRDILIITTPQEQPDFIRALGDGSKFGVNLNYVVQPSPDGLAQAFVLGEEFIGNDSCALVLGDNIFYGDGFIKTLKEARENAENGLPTVFCKKVKDPWRFGVAEFDENKNVISLEEKPKVPKSDFAVTGLYFYDNSVVEKAKTLKPSARGELEITDLNNLFLEEGRLKACLLGGGFQWIDTGTIDSLSEAKDIIKGIQSNDGRIISCLEQIGYDNGWLSLENLKKRAELLKKNGYGEYLAKVAEREPVKILK